VEPSERSKISIVRTLDGMLEAAISDTSLLPRILRALFAGPEHCWNPRALPPGEAWNPQWGIQWPTLPQVSANILLRKVTLLPFVAEELMSKLVYEKRTGGMQGFIGGALVYGDKSATAAVFAALGLSTAPGTFSDQLNKQFETEYTAGDRTECEKGSWWQLVFDNLGEDNPGGHVETVTIMIQVPTPHAQSVRYTKQCKLIRCCHRVVVHAKVLLQNQPQILVVGSLFMVNCDDTWQVCDPGNGCPCAASAPPSSITGS
jgi:hypothetical protein